MPQKKVLPIRTELKIKCKLCKKSFFRELLKKHMKISHPNYKISNKNIKVTCKVCKKSIKRNFLAKHMLISHPDVEIPENENPQNLKLLENGCVQCLECNKTFPKMGNARLHYNNVHSTRIICKVCNVSFGLKIHLERHMQARDRIRLCELGVKFICKLTGFFF